MITEEKSLEGSVQDEERKKGIEDLQNRDVYEIVMR